MKKTFSLIAAFIITIFALPFGDTALADGIDNSTVAPDEAYEIDYVVKHDTEDKESSADGFFVKPANLLYINGEKYVQLTVNSWSMIDSLETKHGDVLVVNENDSTALIQFKVDGELSDVINLDMHITVPGMYSQDHSARFVFNTDSKKEIGVGDKKLVTSDGGNGPTYKEPETPEPEESETNEPEGSDENNQSIIKLDNGSYTMNVSYLRSDNDDASSMGRHLDNSVFLTVKDNKVEATFTVNKDETVTKLQINGKDAVEKAVDGEKRYETFVFDNLDSILDAYVEYQAPFRDSIHYGNAEFRISFDKDSVQNADPFTKPSENIDEDKGKSKDENEDKDKGKDDKKDNDKSKDDDKGKDKDKSTSAQPDKAYKIDYVIKHVTKDEVSSADGFFKKPAHLLYKDGVKYLQLTVTNSDMIKSLNTKNGEVLIVKENSDGSMVIQFKVDGDLSDVINLNMFISVPDMPGMPGGYDMEHDARLFLDPSSMKEVDASEFSLVAGSKDNANGPIIKGATPAKTVNENNGNKNIKGANGDNNNGNDNGKGVNHKIPGKPTFGTNGDVNGNGDTPVTGSKTGNPKTGDTSNVIALSLLLIASLVPLAIKARRRIV